MSERETAQRERERAAPRRATRAHERAAPEKAAGARLQDLQRTRGNAAVGRQLGREPGAAAKAKRDRAHQAFEFRVGGDLPTALARAAKDVAADGPLRAPQLRRLQRVARDNGTPADVQRMFLAGLLDGDNVRRLSRTPLRAGATIDFSLASIRAGMPRVKTLGRRAARSAPQQRRAAGPQAAVGIARGAKSGAALPDFRETRDDVSLWSRTILDELNAWITDSAVIVATFREAAKAGKFVQLQDRLDMERIFRALDPAEAVDVGLLGPVTNGREELTKRRVEYIVKYTAQFGPSAAEVFVHRMFGWMYTDEAVEVLRGLQADARLKFTIALMPGVQDLLKRRGVMAEWWKDREETGGDFWRSAWEAIDRGAYAHTGAPTAYYSMRRELPDDYQHALDEIEKRELGEAFSTGNVVLGGLDHITFGLSSAVKGLVIDTPKGLYHLAIGEYQQAGPELVGLMMIVATYGIAKGVKALGVRAAGVPEAGVMEYTGPKSKALARLEAILQADSKAGAAAASLAELSEAQIDAGGRFVTGSAQNAAFVHRGGFPALKALIEANGDLGAAEARLRGRGTPPQLPAGEPEPAANVGEKSAPAAQSESAASGREQRQTRAMELRAKARRLGRPLKSDLLDKLARSDAAKFERAAALLEAELEDVEMRRGSAKSGEVADEFREAGKSGDTRESAPAETLEVPKGKSTVKLSHDAGVEGGRAKAAEHGIDVVDWDNPESHIPDYGRGFDDIGRQGPDRIILEYKGETSELAEGQMSDRWVGKRIARLKYLNAGMADELLEAARQRKLRGRIYRTTIGPKGKLHTVLEERMTYEPKAVLKAYEAELKALRSRK